MGDVTHVTVAIHFGVDGLDIAANLAGKRRELIFRGYRCAIVLPLDRSSFGVGGGTTDPPRVITADTWRNGEVMTYSVYMVRIEVKVASDLTADQVPWGGPQDPLVIEAAERVFQEAAAIAGPLIRDYVDHVRIQSRQYWLGSSKIDGMSGLVHVGALLAHRR